MPYPGLDFDIQDSADISKIALPALMPPLRQKHSKCGSPPVSSQTIWQPHISSSNKARPATLSACTYALWATVMVKEASPEETTPAIEAKTFKTMVILKEEPAATPSVDYVKDPKAAHLIEALTQILCAFNDRSSKSGQIFHMCYMCDVQ